MLPVIALVGRPNVGKSTLFNQLTKSRKALVADLPGLTRDRQYGEGLSDGHTFIVIDTGGFSGDEGGLYSVMASQSMSAVNEADIVLLLVDARTGLHSIDEELVKLLRRSNKHFHLVVNKIDGIGEDVGANDFFRLGVEHIHTVAAAHNRGVKKLIQKILVPFTRGKTSLSEPVQENASIRMAINPLVANAVNSTKSDLSNIHRCHIPWVIASE